MQDLTNEMYELREELNLAIKVFRARGIEKCEAQRQYAIAKAKAIFIKRDEGIPVTIIHDFIRGEDSIANLRFHRDKAEVLYKSANERILSTKLEINVVKGQMDSERRGV